MANISYYIKKKILKRKMHPTVAHCLTKFLIAISASHFVEIF